MFAAWNAGCDVAVVLPLASGLGYCFSKRHQLFMDIKLLNWNVRGLHYPVKRRSVAKLIAELSCNIVCLQETKLEHFDKMIVSEVVGSRFSDSFLFKPARGSKGGHFNCLLR